MSTARLENMGIIFYLGVDNFLESDFHLRYIIYVDGLYERFSNEHLDIRILRSYLNNDVIKWMLNAKMSLISSFINISYFSSLLSIPIEK